MEEVYREAVVARFLAKHWKMTYTNNHSRQSAMVIPITRHQFQLEGNPMNNTNRQPVHLTVADTDARAAAASATENQQSAEALMADRRMFKALAALRGFRVEDIARAGQTQMQNLLSWLSGNDAALSGHSRYTIWKLVGAPNGVLSPHSVHVWRADASSKASWKISGEALRHAACLIPNAELMVFQSPNRGRLESLVTRDVVAHGLYNGSACVLVLVKQPLFGRKLLDGSEIGAKWKGNGAEKSGVSVPREMLASVLSGNITAREFKDLFTNTGDMKSWSSAIIALRERGISPNDAINWALSLESSRNSRRQEARAGHQGAGS